MKIPEKKWYKAVRKRKSVRNFLPVKLKKQDERDLIKFLKELNEVYKGIRIEYVKEGFEEVAQGFIGSYGKIDGAKSYLVILSEKNTPYK
ncbi:MAG: hypothetical protein K9K32_06665, partial [Halanaerobiales bacterium]|nr:hypothetical protein [Halanaerobiales bacterium]